MRELFGREKPVVGVVHLPPLPGSPGTDHPLTGSRRHNLRERALRDARALARGGVDGMILENYGDAPFFPGRVPAHTVAEMTALARAVRREIDVAMGVNVLRNDGESAMAVAAAVGADFIRVNVFVGVRVGGEGILHGRAHRILRLRRSLGAAVKVFADVDVKHSAPLAGHPVAEEAREAVERGGADGVIVTGKATGRPPASDVLDAVREVVDASRPVLAGSGVTLETLSGILGRCDGAIVGTALKVDGRVMNPVDAERVRELVDAARALRRDAT